MVHIQHNTIHNETLIMMTVIGCGGGWWPFILGGYVILLLFQSAHAAAFLQIGGRFHRHHCYECCYFCREETTTTTRGGSCCFSSTNNGDVTITDAEGVSLLHIIGTTIPIPLNQFNRVNDNASSLSMPTIVSRSAFFASIVMTLPAAAAAAAAVVAMSSSNDNDKTVNMISASSISSSNSILLCSNDDNGSSSQQQKRRDQVLAESLSGSVAGAALTLTKTLVKFPLDTATVRLQTTIPNTYSIFRLTELFDDCYRGVWTPLLANIPAGAVFFAVKDAVQKSLDNDDNAPSSWWTTSVAVAVAQIPYWIVRNPSEVVKTRQQAGVAGYSQGVNSLQAYKQVWQDALLIATDIDDKENISMASSPPTKQFISQQEQKDQESTSSSSSSSSSSLSTVKALQRIAQAYYLGYGENIVYAYPADVIKFLVYDGFKKQQPKRKLTPAEGAIAGAVATGIAQFVTTPLDVIRNRIMTRQMNQQQQQQQQQGEDSQTGNDNTQQQEPSYIEALVQLGRDEGLSGLFAGAVPRVGKAILSGAIQFATYEETKQKMADWFAPPPLPTSITTTSRILQ